MDATKKEHSENREVLEIKSKVGKMKIPQKSRKITLRKSPKK